MSDLFELIERGEIVQISVDFTSEWIERLDEAATQDSDLLRIAQEKALFSLTLFVQRLTPAWDRKGWKVYAQYQLATDFGHHEELGHILLVKGGQEIRLSLLQLDLESGSVIGKLYVGIAGALAMLGSGIYVHADDITEELMFRETVNRSTCATEVTTSFTWHQHIANLISGLPNLSIPKDMEDAQSRSHLPPDENVCAFQIMLSSEHGSNLIFDGKWGPLTYAAWQNYKARKLAKDGKYDDVTALQYLVRDARLNMLLKFTD